MDLFKLILSEKEMALFDAKHKLKDRDLVFYPSYQEDGSALAPKLSKTSIKTAV